MVADGALHGGPNVLLGGSVGLVALLVGPLAALLYGLLFYFY